MPPSTATRAAAPYIGTLPAGPRDAITDVPGIRVGHATIASGPLQTGVTVVVPHPRDPYRQRVPAAASVLNGFGKSVGLVQLDELGVLETPIALTNTFSVARVMEAEIRQCVAANPECGRSLPTVNPLVFECNDGYLNDIQAMAVEERHYLDAFDAADTEVAQGNIGAGRGMSCFGLKGGIGMASRIATLSDGRPFTVGTLVLANFGRPAQITIAGRQLGTELTARLAAGQTAAELAEREKPEKGSIIMLIATDAPLDARQLRRLSLRSGAGLARTGSVFGQGSGDIALAFTTAYTLPLDPAAEAPSPAMLHDAMLDPLFQAAADGIEQAILNALWRATGLTGRDGQQRQALLEVMPELAQSTSERQS